MDKQDELRLFVEELWAEMCALMVGSRLTADEVLQAWDEIHGRLERWKAAEDG